MTGTCCVDCGRDTVPSGDLARVDYYIVRAAVWRAAGMQGWRSGHLCSACLERRLGRPLVDADYLVRAVSVNGERIEMRAEPEYVAWVLAGEKEGELP